MNDFDLNNNHNKINKLMITAPARDEAIALNEIRALDGGARLAARLGGGSLLIETKNDYRFFSEKIKNAPPIFIRQIYPVFFETDSREIETCAESLAGFFNNSKSFSVRIIASEKRNGLSAGEFKNAITSRLAETGFIEDDSSPAQMIFIAVFNEIAYAGVADASDTFGAFSGGVVIKKDINQISRSENKLSEAALVFGLNFKKGGSALDLGAAPGGWSRILAGYEMNVTAVDPADLHVSLAKNKLISHQKKTAGEFIRGLTGERFDMIVNDMRMDADKSIDIMISLKEFLSDGGYCVMTLKLGERNKQKNTARALAILKKHFTVAGARQLYHNRSEVTAILKS